MCWSPRCLVPEADQARVPGDGPELLACGQCFKTYKLPYNLFKHKQFECGQEPRWRCPHCPFRSRLENGLVHHIRAKHESAPPRASLECERLFGVDRPWGVCGPSPELFPCEKCGKAYSLRNNLLRHVRRECGQEPQFRCPHCPKRSKRKSNLLQHIRTKHGTY
ncbi:zinc finger protein 629-like [Bacillus rossius redtenbacheri]|uniref:zinc finger protein 629-like n=1 Tax=Bacillus rossius redtenbacheri TaxID=93214 RepID=UPI002FDEBF5C